MKQDFAAEICIENHDSHPTCNRYAMTRTIGNHRLRAVFMWGLIALWGIAFRSPLAYSQQMKVPSSVRDADVVCADCHREIFQTYLTTPMANASGIALDKFQPGALDHQVSKVSYRLFVRNQQAILSVEPRHAISQKVEHTLSYFLGSGHLGITYLYSTDGYMFESPVAYYSATRSYDMKPGLENMAEMPQALPMQSNCLRCHMSDTQASDQGTINHYSGLPFLHTGITCEACHGNTQNHKTTGGKASVLNPAKLDADRRDSICISCHLEGDVSVENARRSALDYKPGDSISNYLSFFVYEKKDATRRGVSEVEQLALSKCKQKSGDKMACTSCHDPHYTPPPGERAAFFRAKCLTCHGDRAFVASHHPENPDCTQCHMPRNGAQNIPHVSWTDHRLLKTPMNDLSMTSLGDENDLLDIFSNSATKRDLALADYKLLLDGDISLQSKTYLLLEEIKPQISSDKEALDALGLLTQQYGDYQQASELFERVLKLDPKNLIARLNLGVMKAKSGDMQGAIPLLQSVFEQNESVVGIAKNLAEAQCRTGNVIGARSTLEKSLQYNPGLQEINQILMRLPSCSPGKSVQ